MDDYPRRITDWLQSRQELLVNMFKVHQIPLEEMNSVENQMIIKSFCEYLIDYISAGHFEIYHQMMKTLDGQSTIELDQAHSLLNSIQHSTDIAVSFNDQFDLSLGKKVDLLFRQRLSDLAESLAERFELEDILFEQYTSQQSKSMSA